jgi:hypothetical protein
VKTPIARIVSLIGHPLVLLPIAAVATAIAHDASAHLTRILVLAMFGISAIVGVYATYQLRSGAWTHVDAIQPTERRSLNVFLVVLLFAGSLIAWSAFPAIQLSIALCVSGIAVLTALALSTWLKVSLHTCFAAFAAGLLWPNPFALPIGIGITCAVAWSRLVLRRHTRAEVWLGTAIGVVASVSYHFF